MGIVLTAIIGSLILVATAGGKTKEFTVGTGGGRVQTGIVLKPGKKIELTVTGNGKCGEGDDCPAGNPLGSGQTCAERSLGPLAPGPAPNLPYGAVAGQVGDGEPFATGASKTVTGTGELVFFYNDCADYYGDNTGSFTVKVTYGGQGHLTIAASPKSVPGNGLSASEFTVTDLDEKSEPVAEANVHLEPPIYYGEGRPTGIVCDSQGRMVYPSIQGGGKAFGGSFDATADSAGKILLKTWFGPIGGEWEMAGYDNEDPEHQRTFGVVGIQAQGGSSQLPVALTSLLLAAGDDSLGDFAISSQRSVLSWIGRLTGGALAGVGFMPIYAIDAVGATNPGVLLFADNEALRKRILEYLRSGGATPAPSDLEAVVIDLKTMRQLQLGTAIAGHKVSSSPYRLPGLEEWSKGTSIQITDPQFQAEGHATKVPIAARGQARFGIPGATPTEELLFGEGPTPPFGQGADAEAAFSRCTGYQGNTTITPHSPVRLLASSGKGSAGIDPKGVAVNSIPDAIVNHHGAKLASLELPAGKAQVEVTGTGNGPATLVVNVPTGKGIATRVFDFDVKRGQTGVLKINGTAPRAMTWAGGTVKAANGLGLAVRGLPKSLAKAKVWKLHLKVRDQFGKPAGGVSVRLSGAPVGHDLTFQTSPSGVLTATVRPTRGGAVGVRVSGPGFASFKRSLRVR